MPNQTKTITAPSLQKARESADKYDQPGYAYVITKAAEYEAITLNEAMVLWRNSTDITKVTNVGRLG